MQESLIEKSVQDVMRRDESDERARDEELETEANRSGGRGSSDEDKSDFSTAIIVTRFVTREALRLIVECALREELVDLAMVENASSRIYCGVVKVAEIDCIVRNDTMWNVFHKRECQS